MALHLDERIIQSIQRIGQNYEIEEIVLFGSRARGDHYPTSDIDLAVFPSPEFKNRGRLVSDLEDLRTLLKIDIAIIDEQDDSKILDNIRKEGIVIYERSERQIQ